MRWLVCVIAIAACNTTTTSTDAAVTFGGCRFPRKCLALSCDCSRAALGGCVLCDPTEQPSQSCECYGDGGFGGVCLSEAELCQGRAPAICPGAGAVCLPAGGACGTASGVPPQLVSVAGDGGPPTSEPRCAFADDVCCPGTAQPDLSAALPMDLGTTD